MHSLIPALVLLCLSSCILATTITGVSEVDTEPGTASTAAKDVTKEERTVDKAMDINEEKKLRVERIKQQILHKLQMQTRPNITAGAKLSVPKAVFDTISIQSDQPMGDDAGKEEYGELEQISVQGEHVPHCHTHKPAACFSFKMSSTLEFSEVFSAKLYVYKKKDHGDTHNQTLTVHEVNPGSRGKMLSFVETSQTSGWVTIDMTHAFRRYLMRPSPLFDIRVQCKTCQREVFDSPVETTGEHVPWIQIDTSDPRRHRSRRSITCQEGTPEGCCKETLEVNFDEIGWSDWIIQPKRYNANFCRGSCKGVFNPAYMHSQIMQKVEVHESDPSRREELLPCCAPTKMSDISLLYFTDDRAVAKKNLKAMIVDACGCA